MCTDKQRLANQQNARKSTGPKTTEGKENSRRNALQHGLTGSGTVLTRSDDRKLKKALKAWREHLQPIDVLEDSLVVRAALADVRLKRCRKKDLADLARRKRRANKRWDVRQQKATDQCAELLETDPERAVAQFEASSLGCNWLIEHWKELRGALEEPGFWDDAQARRAVRMCGKDPETTPMNDSSIAKLRLAILAVSPEPDADAVDAYFEESSADLDPEARIKALSGRLPDTKTGRAMLLDIIEQEVARLEPMRKQLWVEQDEPERQEAEDISLVDTSPTGARSLRYESANEMSLHRSVNLLIRLRKVESEQQTYDRWSKMGKPQGRRLDGAGLEVPGAERGAQSADPDAFGGGDSVAKPVFQNEANFPDVNKYEKSAYVDSAAGSPTMNGEDSEEARKLGSVAGSPAPSTGQEDKPSVAPSRVRNEPKFLDVNGTRETVYDDQATGSPTAIEAERAHDPRAIDSNVGDENGNTW